MPDIDERQTLGDVLVMLVSSCPRCYHEFYSNVALIADDNGNLTTPQLKACVEHLNAGHEKHVH